MKIFRLSTIIKSIEQENIYFLADLVSYCGQKNFMVIIDTDFPEDVYRWFGTLLELDGKPVFNATPYPSIVIRVYNESN